MSTVISLTHSCEAVQHGAPGVRNIARFGRQWFVELAPLSRYDYLRRRGGRVDVPASVGRAMVAAAQRAGNVERVHRWGAITTWHLRRESGR